MRHSFTTIPTLDLQDWSTADAATQNDFAERLLQICHETGFFLLVGHGIEQEWVDRYFAALQQFFALPLETKSLIDKRASPEFRGWEGVGAELTNNRVDYREQLDVCTENPRRQRADHQAAYLRLDGPNQWLPDHLLPGFTDVVKDFMSKMGSLADALMAALATGLGLPASHFTTVFGGRPFSLTKLIRYPKSPTGEFGVNAHHDAGFLTVLLQHGVGGLQALNPSGEWIDVPPTPGAFVINLGEMLQEMTGNYVVATTHRVVATQERYSSAYFHGPDLTTPLDRLPLDSRFTDAVAASPRHRNAGFMAKRDELLTGSNSIASPGSSSGPTCESPSGGSGIYGQQLWNYYARSYPANMAAHHSDL
jgi:isopenicillin N synthase-like dioxygenase